MVSRFLALLLPVLSGGMAVVGSARSIPMRRFLRMSSMPVLSRLRGGGEVPFCVFVTVEIEPSRVEEFIKVMNVDAAGAL